MDNPIVWFVDEDKAQLKTYQQELQQCLGDTVEVRGIAPYPDVEDYVDPVLNNQRTVSLVIDQRLKDTGIAKYHGIELAKFLRGINSKLPVYILTNYGEDEEFTGGEWSIEYVIPKSAFSDPDKERTMGARMLRHINIYQDILDHREARFHELIKKSLTSDLTKEEIKELSAIETFRASGIAASELRELEELERIVAKHRQLLDAFKDRSKPEDQ